MPLSSVVGAQSIVKPGVCTSSTRPASPYDGQVIYETDTDRAMVWNNSAWVVLSTGRANSLGLDLISTTTFTTTTTWSVNNCFSSLYDNYCVMATWTLTALSNYCMLRMRASGTDNSSANYQYGMTESNQAGTTNRYSTTATGHPFADLDASNAIYDSAKWDIFQPFLATPTKFFGGYSTVSTGLRNTVGGGFHNVSTSYDGFSIVNGGSSSGTVSVYGYAK